MSKFHGLFIGVDKYSSPDINELSCAANDAKSLYSLFADNLGEKDAKMLLNERATKDAIVSDVKDRLSQVSADDLVFISYSGHGSDDHHLVTYDSDPLKFKETSIALDELVELFKAIPSKNVIMLLDCCFSGGAGARVFKREIAMRAIESTDAIIKRISGEGRLIVTASGAGEEAIEDRKRGHGLLTHFFTDGLLGNTQVTDGGKINIYSLLEFVTSQVKAAASIFRHVQSPTVRGAIDGELTFPVFKRGSVFNRFFPERNINKVTADISSLASFGIPNEVIAIWKNKTPQLNNLQQLAINDHGLLNGEHLVVSAPTSSGKTMVAEIAAVKSFFQNKRSVILLPLKALVNDKYAEFQEKYEAYGLRVVRATGEISDDIGSILRGRYDIALLTYEKFASLLLSFPFIINSLGLVVVDEAQMLADKNRGANLEFLLTVLRNQRLYGYEPQMLLLSAVIGNINGLDKWLGARFLKVTERPVPLQEGLICRDGSFRYLDVDGTEHRTKLFSPEYLKNSGQDLIIPLVQKLANENEKVIVFRETKSEAMATANYLARELNLESAEETLEALPTGDASGASERLRDCVSRGLAFHTASLDRDERSVIESAFRDSESKIRVLAATTTVAMGVNTPASSVIIAGLMHPLEQPYSVAEYKNMVGRAGRLGFVEKGKSFIVAMTPADEQKFWRHYVLGQPEDLQSQFGGGDLLSTITRVFATANSTKSPGMQTQDVVDFLFNSFAATQRSKGTQNWTSERITQAMGILERNRLIENDDLGYRLTGLGKLSGESGVEVVSIIRLVEALRGIAVSQISDADLIYAAQITKELDDLYFPTHKRSHQEQDRWRQAAARDGLSRNIRSALERHLSEDGDATARFKKGAATFMWISGNDMTEMEKNLMQHLRDSDAAGAIRGAASRTRDLLPTVAKVVEILNGSDEALAKRVEKLVVRLELGINEELLDLAMACGNSITRSDYLNMQNTGIKSLQGIAETPEALDEVIKSDSKKKTIYERIKKHLLKLAEV